MTPLESSMQNEKEEIVMKEKKAIRSYILGVLTTLLLFSLAIPALAATGWTITVTPNVNIYIDDVKLDPTDVNGKSVEAFIYNGTTYLPVRAVSEALGKPVQWDGKTRSVYVGRHSSDKPAAWLSQMDYFNKLGHWEFGGKTTDNLGTAHLHSLDMCNGGGDAGGFITYKLNGQYRRLTGLYYQEYDYRSDDYGTFTLVITGDGAELWRGVAGAGIDPVSFDVDLTGVLELTLEFPAGEANWREALALGDVALYT